MSDDVLVVVEQPVTVDVVVGQSMVVQGAPGPVGPAGEAGPQGPQGIQGPPGSSSGVADGNKGDVTVSSSGEVWTINNAVVTDAKIVSLSWGKITDAPAFAAVATSGAYADLSGRPTLGTAAATDAAAYATAAQGAKADSAVQSNTTGVTGADQITNIISLTQAEYDAIGSKSATTLYVIAG